MRGKVCLVTGGTSGIGLATALGLARQGATVILVGRDRGKGSATVQRIRADTGSTSVECLPADLSIQAEVRRAACEIQARHLRLDVLINNAGSFFHRRQESADGIEMTWALNVLAPYLLTELLLPALKASAPARIINLSSFTQRLGRVRLGDPEGKRWYCRVQAYAQSKRAILLLTSELARRLRVTAVTANAVDPGFVATGIISRNAGQKWAPIQRVVNLVARTPQEGARVIFYLATSPDVVGISGRYLKIASPTGSSIASSDETAARRLRQICEAMTGVGYPASGVC